MDVRRRSFAVMWTLALAWMLAACSGGSGSSGFDAITEDAAIQRVLATQRCVIRDGLDICPTNTAATIPSTPGRAEQRVDITFGDALTCTLNPSDGCSFALPFTVSGFPSTTRFHVAVRTLDQGVIWSVGPELVPHDQQQTPAFDTPVAVEGGPRAPLDTVDARVAVLVFLAPRAPVPTIVRELAETAADFAFVSDDLLLVAVAAPGP